MNESHSLVRRGAVQLFVGADVEVEGGFVLQRRALPTLRLSPSRRGGVVVVELHLGNVIKIQIKAIRPPPVQNNSTAGSITIYLPVYFGCSLQIDFLNIV
jgi:hypothetical protein